MALPIYSTDLTSVSEVESNTGWSELAGFSGGGADATEDTSWIQGDFSVSQSTGVNTNTGLAFDFGSDLGVGWVAGHVFLAWQIFLAPSAINTWALGGVRFGMGSANGDVKMFNAVGSDFGKYPYGGWQNTAIDPTGTADQTVGTPIAGNYTWFATLCNLTTAVSKGNPHGIDAIRYGRGELLIELGDLANGYGTFLGVATQNDAQLNRWGLLQKEGTGYLWKGLMSFGNATNVCDFRDSNVNITVDNTPRTYATFNKIEVNNAGSRLDWTAVGVTALLSTQLSVGGFEAVDNAVINKDACTFTDMGTFVYQSNTTLLNSIYRRCGLVTQGSGIITGCIFDNASGAVALAVDALSNVTGCTFNSDGTGHAVDLGTFNADETITWNNNDSGYAISDGASGNETIVVSVDSGVILTINVADGASTPTINNIGLGTVNVVAGQVTLTLTGLPDGIEVRIRQGSYTLQHTQDVVGGEITYSYSYIQDEKVTIGFSGAGIIQSKTIQLTLGNTNQSSLITFTNDPSYGGIVEFSCFFTGIEDVSDINVHTITMVFNKEPKVATMTIANITQEIESNGIISNIGVTGDPLIWEFDFTANAGVVDVTNYYKASTSILDIDDNPLATERKSANFDIDTTTSSVFIAFGRTTPAVAMPSGITINDFIAVDRTDTSVRSLVDFNNDPSEITIQWTDIAIGDYIDGTITGDNSGCLYDFQLEEFYYIGNGVDNTGTATVQIYLPLGTYNIRTSGSKNLNLDNQVGEYTLEGFDTQAVPACTSAGGANTTEFAEWTNVISNGQTFDLVCTIAVGSVYNHVNGLNIIKTV